MDTVTACLPLVSDPLSLYVLPEQKHSVLEWNNMRHLLHQKSGSGSGELLVFGDDGRGTSFSGRGENEVTVESYDSIIAEKCQDTIYSFIDEKCRMYQLL